MRWNADAAIAYHEPGLPIVLRDGDLDQMPLTEPDRVLEELVDDAPERGGVPLSDDGTFIVQAHVTPRLRDAALVSLDAVARECQQIDGRTADRERAEIQLRDEDQLFDESAHSRHLTHGDILECGRGAFGLPLQSVHRELQGGERGT